MKKSEKEVPAPQPTTLRMLLKLNMEYWKKINKIFLMIFTVYQLNKFSLLLKV